MIRDPDIAWSGKWRGYRVEKHRHSDRLGFLPEFFWVCRAGPHQSSADGHGHTRDAAIADMLAKAPTLRKAA